MSRDSLHYYNEIDPYCCKVLRARIADGSLPAGDVDERDIRDVQPDDVRGYRQCHFFAGIGGFPLGIKWAGAERLRMWTGGFPCQDISNAGGKAGLDGERSGLWFDWLRLIRAVRPAHLLIENVAALVIRGLRTVLGGLAEAGFDAEWGIVSAAQVRAPHLRERLWIAANSIGGGFSGPWQPKPSLHPAENPFGEASGLVNAFRARTLPYVCRGHDGVSEGVDRLAALGNAVVPQVVAHIARAMIGGAPC